MTTFATWLRGSALAAAALAISAASAIAAPITGTGTLGSFTGTLTYNASSNTAAMLSVALTNTSPVANGGFITAFVLNNPGDLITSVNVTSGLNFDELGLSNNGVNGSPYGAFDFGASTGNGFEGGGAPQDGIGVGTSRTIVFSLTGTNLLSLTDASFLNTLSAGNGNQPGEDFVVRFRGFADGGSDKVPNSGGTPPVSVPEPASLALFGAGLLGLGAVARRRRKETVAG